MAKPFMCGDEPATYIPAGGCDCNYTIQEYNYEDETDYKLLQDGGQVGDTIVVPKYDDECNCNYMINSLEVSDPDQYVAQYALVQDGVVSGDIINIPKQEGGGGGGDDCNCDYRIEAVSTSTYQAAYKLTLDGVQKGAGINIPKYPSPEIVDTRYYTAVSSDPDHPDVHTWVKYSNGVAVEYRTINIPATAGTQVGSSNIYMEKTEGRLWSTGLFVASPTAVANCYWTNGSCWCNISACTSTEFSVILFKLNTTNARAIVRVQAMGRWKTIS